MRLIALLFLLVASVTYGKDIPLQQLQLPPGFTIEIFAEDVPDARSMTRGSKDIVFVGSRTAGKVYALISDAESPQGIHVITIASNLNMPNGVAFHQGNLYVAEIDRIIRFDDIENHLTDVPKPVVIKSDLPKETHHGWRYLRVGPDNKLYISIGVPCNVCESTDPRFGTIMRMNLDGSDTEIYTKGVRNSVGFDWDPLTNALWFTDNGRDMLGDNLPPDKLNYAPKKGMDFGFPYYNGKNLPDPQFGKLRLNMRFTPPTLDLPAHVAPLGIRFYTGKLFPSEYQNQIFIAEHGSWNRSSKVGYQVILVSLKGNAINFVKPFITGWLQDEKPWGRPVDLLVMPDGTLLISDDHAGAIYRVRYQEDNKVSSY